MPTTLTRLLVAATVLLGSVASGPTFGHAHHNGHTHHVHVDWDANHDHEDADDGHATSVVESNHDDDPDRSVAFAAGLELHLHGVLFGIPVSVPVPAEPDSDHETRTPIALAYVLRTPMLDGCSLRSLDGRVFCPEGWGLAPPLRAAVVSTGRCFAYTSADISLEPPCALKAQSGVLRC